MSFVTSWFRSNKYKDGNNTDVNITINEFQKNELKFSNDNYINQGMIYLYITFINSYYTAEKFKKKSLDEILKKDYCLQLLGYVNVQDLYVFINKAYYKGMSNMLWKNILNRLNGYHDKLQDFPKYNKTGDDAKEIEIYMRGVEAYIKLVSAKISKLQIDNPNLTYLTHRSDHILFDDINENISSPLINVYYTHSTKIVEILGDNKNHIFVGDTLASVNNLFQNRKKQPSNSFYNLFTDLHKMQRKPPQLQSFGSVSNLLSSNKVAITTNSDETTVDETGETVDETGETLVQPFLNNDDLIYIIDKIDTTTEKEIAVTYDSIYNTISVDKGSIVIKQINGRVYDIQVGQWMFEEI